MKSKGPKGLQLKVGARRASGLLAVTYHQSREVPRVAPTAAGISVRRDPSDQDSRCLGNSNADENADSGD